MPLLRRASESSQSDWRPVPEGLARFVVGKPEVKLSEKYGNYQVRLPLNLTPSEIDRVLEEYGKPDDGVQQSYRTSYTVGLSLGYVDKTGSYKSTKLTDFLAACFAKEGTKRFMQWIAGGGGPPRPADLDDQQAELAGIGDWLGWWEGLEVYGTITHRDAADGSTTYANFAGPMAVGSLPGEKDEAYTAHARGKLRSLIVESGEQREDKHRPERQEAQGFDRFTADGKPVRTSGPDDDSELPF